MPVALVAQGAAAGSDFLALTNTDGLYDAVKHVRACPSAGIRPGPGADLAVHDDEHRPLGRVTVLARAGHGRGYAALCRAVSSAHQTGRMPSIDRRQLATWAEGHTLTVLLCPLSDVPLAVERRDSLDATAALGAWLRVMPIGSVTLEVACHLAPTGQRGSVAAATRMLGLSEDTGTTAILSNAVRYGEPEDAATADLADATRLLRALAQLTEPQANGQAWLKDSVHMRRVARMVVDAGARNPGALDLLFRTTQELADRCALDPAEDLGLGTPRMPEASIIDVVGDPVAELWRRALAPSSARHRRPLRRHHPHRRRPTELAHKMETVEHLAFAAYFLTVARVTYLIRGMGVRVQARGSGVGSALKYALRTSSVEPIENGLIWERFLSPERQTLPDIDLLTSSSPGATTSTAKCSRLSAPTASRSCR
ncbi:error-prone DNA polymerase [Cryobacterium roopkundense]|uniref:Error-prone DNA polymerase n=2 Tax=Cryobacterium roopkundense TaxID=1001240 RepID=A0A7W8ZWT7_9MICO|nr:error-prone DNA polymerase [Cryobacterium roopkundense]